MVQARLDLVSALVLLLTCSAHSHGEEESSRQYKEAGRHPGSVYFVSLWL